MRKVFLMGAVILLGGAVGVAVAQERLPQVSGFNPGVGEASRSQILDKQAFLERLSQPETVMGRVFAIDFTQNRLMIETGGAGYDEGQEGKAGYGARTIMTLYMNERSNVQQIKALNVGDEIAIQALEETTTVQPYGTGKKMVLEVSVLRQEETKSGFGGLGQRPDPATERAIVTNSGSGTGGPVGMILPGEVTQAQGFTSQIGEVTGAAPCWNCDPQPGWGYTGGLKSDYGSSEKPQMKKGLDAQAQ